MFGARLCQSMLHSVATPSIAALSLGGCVGFLTGGFLLQPLWGSAGSLWVLQALQPTIAAILGAYLVSSIVRENKGRPARRSS